MGETFFSLLLLLIVLSFSRGFSHNTSDSFD